MIQELNEWHFQCLHPSLTPAKITRYKQRFNDFIEEMWSASDEEDVPQLEVAEVENCVDEANRPSAVRVRLRLRETKNASSSSSEKAFQHACRRLCEGIFSSMLNRDLLQSLSLVTNYALMGIAPLSPVLKVSWMTIALAQAVAMEPPTFRIFFEPKSFWAEWGKGLFVALTLMYGSHFEGIGEPINQDRLISIGQTALTIVRGATGFARNHVDAEILKRKDKLEEDFVLHAKKFEIYQKEIERNPPSEIKPDTVIAMQELMIDINSKAFDLMCITHEVETVLLSMQNEQRWAAATAGGMSMVGVGALGASIFLGCALWACITPAAIAIVAGGLAIHHYGNIEKHQNEGRRMQSQRNTLQVVQGHIKSYAAALLYPMMRGGEDIELSETPSSTGSGPTGSNPFPQQHQKDLEGLHERFSKMRREGITQTKWFKAIATAEGQLVVNSFKALRNDPDFKARWNFPHEEPVPVAEAHDDGSDNSNGGSNDGEHEAEIQLRLEQMAEHQSRNGTAIANIRDEFRSKLATRRTGKGVAILSPDSGYDSPTNDPGVRSSSSALTDASEKISLTLRKRQPLAIV